MLSIVLNEIEKKITHLSRQDQLWLIEMLARRLREEASDRATITPSGFATQLVAMANDPEVQAEVQRIDDEFANTEWDGLKGE